MNRGSLHRVVRATAIRAAERWLGDALAAVVTIFDERQGLYLHGRISDIRYRHADRTDFWHDAAIRFPASPRFLRNKIHAALRAGRTSDAETGLELLLRTHRVEAADCKFVVGLSYIYDKRDDKEATRGLVRKFLRALIGTEDFRVAAVCLSRLLFAHFPRKRSRDIAAQRNTYRRQFLKMLERSQVRTGPKGLLKRVALCEERLAAKSPLALFDTDISREQCQAFVGLVRARLAAGEPFSFVRVGDGEAACLPYEPHLSSLANGDAIDRERIWWGRPLHASQRSHLSTLVSDAIWSADCIGIPPVSRFLRELRLTSQDCLEVGLTGRGLRSILYAAENYEKFRPYGMQAPAFASCHLHQELERWQLYPALFDGVRDVVILSCHPGLAEIISLRFGVGVAGNILLPPDRVSSPMLKDRTSERRSLPEMLDEVVENLGDLPRNRLVLVGAGYLGKWLVDVSRARGGVALDVGSIFDYWVGLTTRSYLDLNSA